jgi:crotonobetainyl-CoA:carnitine CoA-transferase CaiB-like acyl-CoA transferase
VIKVEPPEGDESRHLGPERAGERAPFLAVNRNKRSIVLDLATDLGQVAFQRLIGTADVLITNVREPALSRLGLGYDQVRTHRADIIWAGVTGFGPDGPYSGRPAIDFLAQGIAGLISLNGERDGSIVRVSVPLVDVMTSMLVANGVLAALLERGRSGLGQRIDLSLLNTLVHAQATGLASLFLSDEVLGRTGNRSRYFAPSGVFECSDGKLICITCPSQKFFRNFCDAVGQSWIDEPRFATIDLRMEHEDDLEALIAARCKAYTRDDLLARLAAADVLAAPVNDLSEVVRDPQVLHNEMVVTTNHPALGPYQVTGVPIRLGRTPGAVRMSPPTLGQHTHEVLTELGFDEGEIERMC